MAADSDKPYGLMERELKEYRKFFLSQDGDGDGQLSRAEFTVMLGKMGLNLNQTELNNLFSKTDVDRSNKISFHEFAEAFVSKKRVSTSQEQLWRVFHDADRDHDQYLTRTECFAALKQLGHVMDDRGIKRVMSIMDKNGDGRISFQEFCKFMQ